MKKNILFLFVLLLTLGFVACSEKGDEPSGSKDLNSPIRFKVENIIDPDNLTYYYQSPDPGCGIPMMYEICVNNMSSEIVMKCENFNEIYIEMESSIWADATRSVYVDKFNQWTAKIADGNTLTITFDSATLPEGEWGVIPNYTPLKIVAYKGLEMYSDYIHIIRFFDL